MGKIFVLMGKSASGKDSLCAALRTHFGARLQEVVGYTTRPIRSGEREGEPYHFIDGEQLQAFRREGRVIEERCYQTVYGPWIYATLADGRFDPARGDFLTVGTLQSFAGLARFFGRETLVPLYIEVENSLRLFRALEREQKQSFPRYAELCRRYLADEADFSPEKLAELALPRRFENRDFDACLAELIAYVEEQLA